MQVSPTYKPTESDDYRACERFYSKPRYGNSAVATLPEPPTDDPNQLSFDQIWENVQ